ncbi:MAG: magnesium transporter [Chitinispirillales bacterium]|jgi:magnesium transporter|nr:magnesium transporter [Chitinispirillales bacterium]
MLKELLTPEIVQFIRERQWAAMRDALVIWPPAEVADLLQSLEQPERVLLLRFLPRSFEAEVFSELTPKLQDEMLGGLTNHEVRVLLAELNPDDRAALIDEMPAEVTRRLFNLLSPEDLKETRWLLGYPEGSIGRVMTPNFVDIKAEMTVEEALSHIREYGRASETINVVFVVDEKGKLVDEVSLRHLILAPPETKVRAVMDGNIASLSGYCDQEEAVAMIKKYNYLALPVVDSAGILLGIVTIDDLMDVAEAEVTEDFHKLGAVSMEAGGEGPIESIREAAVSLLFRRRIGWLVLLVFINVFSGFGILFFEEIIAAVVALVFFMPLLVGCGGNAGSQSATLLVRALATGDVKMDDLWKMFLKEFFVSLLLGLTMGAAVFGIAYFRGGTSVGIVVAVSMVLIVMASCIVGMLLPFVLQRFGKDPATASAPLITSLADIGGILIYFSIASKVIDL